MLAGPRRLCARQSSLHPSLTGDEKIEHVLGHFQKDFEGGVSAKNLGAIIGGYGSFLPAYECSPFRSHPNTSQKNCISPKSPYNRHVEAASDNSTAPSHVPPSTRLGTTLCIGAETCSLKNDSTNKSEKSAFGYKNHL